MNNIRQKLDKGLKKFYVLPRNYDTYYKLERFVDNFIAENPGYAKSICYYLFNNRKTRILFQEYTVIDHSERTLKSPNKRTTLDIRGLF